MELSKTYGPSSAPTLAADSLTARYDKAFGASPCVLSDLTLRLDPGELTALIGPNGSGKSSLLRALSRAFKPESGAVLLDERDLYTQITPRESAREISVVPQSAETFLDFTVRDIVAMGRAPRRAARGLLSPESPEDDAAVQKAMDRMAISLELAERPITQISGGERQRALIARAIAQDAAILLLDEPTSALDLRSQVTLLPRLRRMAVVEGRAVLIVLHDINLAAEHADRIVVMNSGRIVADGAPSAVLTGPLLAKVYGVKAILHPSPLSGRPYVFPVGLA